MNEDVIITNREYVVSQAEDGKFAWLSPEYLYSTLGYPLTSGAGRYAIFTYQTNPTTFADGAAFDAFGRFRVSEVTTIMDVKLISDDASSFVDSASAGTATGVYDIADSSYTLSTASDGDYFIRQTYQRASYQSGKSQQIFMTGAGFDPETNVTKRIGYFSSGTAAPYVTGFDGLFFESSNDTVSINIYKNGSETESTSQSAWNIDPLDGTGPSGITIDWSLNQIFTVDFEWLGVGRVRWGLNIDGLSVPIHDSLHANNTLTGPYMTSPNKPLRWEIRQSGAGSGSFKQICATVGSEGGLNRVGALHSAQNTTSLNIGNTNTYALYGLRQKTTHPGKTVDIQNVGLQVSSTNDIVAWALVLNPTVAGSWDGVFADIPDSGAQVAVGTTANTVTVGSGTIIRSGFITTNGSLDVAVESSRKIGSALDGTRDQIVLIAKGLTTGTNVYSSITWGELD